ncbi:MAG TPA: hypothetical protein VFP94_10030, partial [Terriglobales bacterium]|nr:hypothetical protein [Terriglobales bacterium]
MRLPLAGARARQYVGLLGAIFCVAVLAQASAITYNFNGVLDNGTSSFTQFTFDAGTGTVLSYAVNWNNGAIVFDSSDAGASQSTRTSDEGDTVLDFEFLTTTLFHEGIGFAGLPPTGAALDISGQYFGGLGPGYAGITFFPSLTPGVDPEVTLFLSGQASPVPEPGTLWLE